MNGTSRSIEVCTHLLLVCCLGVTHTVPLPSAHAAGDTVAAAAPNHAERATNSLCCYLQMATFAKANQLLDEVTKDARPAAIREDQQLTSFAHQQTGDQQLQLEWWDRSYWSERQKEKLFQFRQEELKQYLPLDSVRHGLFQVCGCVCVSRLVLACDLAYCSFTIHKSWSAGNCTLSVGTAGGCQ